ncbi:MULTISPECIES: HEPN domain-containing protein [Acinetobacter]|uniref:Uncharacterized protein n=1 Tax=Acinetobacter bouvetii TaxID=202951 RepID=A0A4Q7B1A9_9GAMM|nr:MULTISPECIES: HEPN domain-containing protein [Acinetobacter]RZG68276.1 hypothetical protein EXE25_04265 [Acinetobacter bouvetii]TCB73609.1 hypothetical protein E0H91_11660 [Acinetobacter sp. ANC 4177]
MNRSKEKRTLQRMINSLFSEKAFIKINSIEDIKNLDDFLGQELRLSEKKSIFITTDTRLTLRSITNRIISFYDLEEYITFSEVFLNLEKVYADYLLNNKHLANMLDDVYKSAKSEINTFNNLMCCEGVKLKNIKILNCGNYWIVPSDISIFNEAYGKNDPNFYEMMKDYLWIIGSEEGSKKQVQQRFDYQTNLITSFLNICFQTVNKKSIFSYRIQVLNSSSTHKSRQPRLQWKNTCEGNSFSYAFPSFSIAEIDSELLEYFRENLFFDSFFNILQSKEKTEVQDAIIKAVYWYCEATKDNNATMKFIKLWSCIECFFSITDTKISESNAKGLACILVYGGYGIYDVNSYNELKIKIKKLYAKRSKALHRAYWSNIENIDVIELANWSAWLIISALGLSVVGNYSMLSQIKEQSFRLDDLQNKMQ